MASDFSVWLTRQYIKPQGKIPAMTERDKPFLSMLDKQENRGGADFQTPAYVSTPRGWGRTRAQAQAISGTTAGNGQFGTWTSTPGTYSGDVEFSDREVESSNGMSDSQFVAFAESQKTKVEGLFSTFGDIMSRFILGPPGGYIFQASAISAGGVITIDAAHAERVADVEVGDHLVLSATDGDEVGDSLINNNIGYVIGVDLEGDTPTVTVSPSPGGSAARPSGWDGATDGFLYRNGEFQGGIDRGPNPTNSTLVIDSFQSWNPSTALTNTFKGVDRSLTSRLTGVRQTSAAGKNIEETLEDLFKVGRSRHGWKGGQKIFLHTNRFVQLSRSLETRRLRGLGEVKYEVSRGEKKSAYASFGYNKIALMSTSGAFEVIDEPHMPEDVAYAIPCDQWVIRALSGFPNVIDKDGTDILRKTSEDNYALRAKCYASFMLKANGMISHNGRTVLPDAA